MKKKYTVNESIWIAAASHAFGIYKKNAATREIDLCLKATKLRQIAQEISEGEVRDARIHQHTNGDHDSCSNRFLRRIELNERDPFFRVTATGEFEGDREYPDGLNMEDVVILGGNKYVIGELKSFLDNEYVTLLESFEKVEESPLYTIEQIRASLASVGIEGKTIASNMVQIGAKATTIHVTNENGIILYATDKDFSNISNAKNLRNNVTTYNPQSKEIMQEIIDGEAGRSEAVLCFENGNKTLHPNSAANYNPHEIRIYSNKTFDKIFKIITGAEMKVKKRVVTNWMMSGNPSHFDVIGAFAELGKLNWRQTFNAKEGDFVYLYISDTVREIRYKCRINKVELQAPEIDDSKFNKSDDSEENYGRYMELEPIREYGGTPYSREELMKHGFKTLMGPMRVPEELQKYLDSLEKGNMGKNNRNGQKEEFDKNLILYGPPGTGKTYNTAIIAVKICEPSFDTSDYGAVMDKYNELKSQGRIAFTTFHQSYGYEEFIEGIKPIVDEDSENVGYKVESGAFKRFCEIARTPVGIDVDPNAIIWFMRLESAKEPGKKQVCFENGIITQNCKDQWEKERFVNKMKIGDYIISYADSSENIDAIGIIEGEAETFESEEVWSRKIAWTLLDEKKNVREINGGKYLPNFSCVRMSNMKVSDLLRLLPQNNYLDETYMNPYVFIIDEINRGNISKIFGELITLIEGTKRDGMEEAASAMLPYSGENFSVPSNVYILGTMNTADRSIALMDTALRRRFSFIEMMPDAEVLRKIGADVIEDEGETLDVATMLETINERIEFLYDREHTIGHAFFTGLVDEPSIEKLASIFKKSVIPLLQEYFYEDYQKIQLVLGDNAKGNPDLKFIRDSKVSLSNIFMGSVEDVVDEREIKYSINEDAFWNIEAYKTIGRDL